MKRASLLLLPGIYLLAGCVPTEQAKGLPMVCSGQLGTPAAFTVTRAKPPLPDADLAGKVYFVGREILAVNKNSGLDPNLTFITYPSSSVEIFHPTRTQIYVTEGLVRSCSPEQLAAMLALEMGKIAVERIAASPYLDTRSYQTPVVPPNIDSDAPAPAPFWAEWTRSENQQRARTTPLPEPRQLAQVFLDKARYSKILLDTVGPILEEAGRNHTIEMQIRGLPCTMDGQLVNSPDVQ